MAELVVVGCGTVVPEGDRAASSYFVEDGERRMLFDCGPGAVQALARLELPWQELTDLAITHFHADHIGALPGLFFAFRHGRTQERSRPLDVWGPAGVVALFDRLVDAFGDFMIDPGFEVRIHEIDAGEVTRLSDGVTLATHKTPHTEESLAYRLDGPWGSFGYSGDTGRSESLGPFMREVDVLVCECSLHDDEVGDNHLSPSAVAAIAGEAVPGTLILTHIYPHLRTARDVAALVQQAGYEGGIRIAHEGLHVGI